MLHWFPRRSRPSRRTLSRRRIGTLLYLEPLETRALLSAGSLLNPLTLLGSPPHADGALVAAHPGTAAPALVSGGQGTQALAQAVPLNLLVPQSDARTNLLSPTGATAAPSGDARTAQPNQQGLEVVTRIDVFAVNGLVTDLRVTIFITRAAAQTPGSTTPGGQDFAPLGAQPTTTGPGLTGTPPSATAPQATLGTTALPPSDGQANAASFGGAPILTFNDIRFLLSLQPRLRVVETPVFFTPVVNGESLALASQLSPLPSNADRQNLPASAAFNAVPGPLQAGGERGLPFLQRVIGGVGGEEVREEPEVAPPVMPWNAAALPAVTPPAAHTPAALTVLDALDAAFADDFRADVRREEARPLEGNQGGDTALAPAVALGGLALVLGGCWAPPADAYDREERKLPKGH